MKLPDFLQDDGLNRLRQKMKAEQFGEFELFDAERQLTSAELELLETGEISINSAVLRVLKDKTLAYKNSRIWLHDNGFYHLAYCQRVQALRHRADTLTVGTGDIPFNKNGPGICLECLSVLQYQGVDARRMRRSEFAEQISEHFSLVDFKQEYPFYPV